MILVVFVNLSIWGTFSVGSIGLMRGANKAEAQVVVAVVRVVVVPVADRRVVGVVVP